MERPGHWLSAAAGAGRETALRVEHGLEAGKVEDAHVFLPRFADALRPLGVTDIPLPATPYAIWRAIRVARGIGSR
jgi:hypothetical protein